MLNRIASRILFAVLFLVIVGLAGECGSPGPSAATDPPLPPATAQATAWPTSTTSPPIVKTGYQGGNPFGRPTDQVVNYLNDVCFSGFEFDSEGYYKDFYVYDAFGFSLTADDETRNGPLFAIGIILDFSGDLRPEPNVDLASDIGACIETETGVPMADAFSWVSDHSTPIVTAGNEGYYGTVRGWFVGGFYDLAGDLFTLVISQ